MRGSSATWPELQDVPVIAKWMKDNNVSREGQKQDYICFLPVYIMQDGTPRDSKVLAKGEVGAPTFWQKSPKNWAEPDNTLSRNCAGCHATGVTIKTKDFPGYKSVVTDWDYKDMNITCEHCHGPGSEHAKTSDKTKIIAPKYLTAKAGNELCGQCHASHDGKSQNPMGIFKPPFDANYKDTLGHGFFVPGVYDLETFYLNLCQPSPHLETDWKEGSFHTWPDQTHGRSHSMELCELQRSAHWSNGSEKLTCYTCHDAHTLDGGPASLKVGSYDFVNAAYGNNTLCLACHATRGQFKDVSKADVAVLQLDAGRKVTKDGAAVSVKAADAALARNRVARAWPSTCRWAPEWVGLSIRPTIRTCPWATAHRAICRRSVSCRTLTLMLSTTLNSTRMGRVPWPRATYPPTSSTSSGPVRARSSRTPTRQRATTTTLCRTPAASVTPSPGSAAIRIKVFL